MQGKKPIFDIFDNFGLIPISLNDGVEKHQVYKMNASERYLPIFGKKLFYKETCARRMRNDKNKH